MVVVRKGTSGLVRRNTTGGIVTSTRNSLVYKSSLMGTNLVGLEYYGSTRPFIDMMKCSSDWVNNLPSFDHVTSISTDTNGWITSIDSTASQRVISYIFSSDNNGTEDMNTEGNYLIVYYSGDGSNYGSGLDWWFTIDSGGSISLIEHDTDAKRLVLSCSFGNYLLLYIDYVNEGDPIKDIKIIPESLEALHLSGEIFHPEYIEYCEQFSCLRFMDWAKCNSNDSETWAERRDINYRNYSGGSWTNSNANITKSAMVPYEMQAELCNIVKADMWANTPYAATSSDWASNCATQLLSLLDSGLDLYIERSNECWNGIFPQNQHDFDQGQVLYPAEGNIYYRGWKYSAHAARLVMEEFEAVWTGSNEARLHTLYAWQKNTDGVSDWLSDWEGLKDHIKHWSIAPYAAGQNAGGSGSKLGTNPQATVSPVSPHTMSTINYTVDMVVDDLFTDLTTDLAEHDSMITLMEGKSLSVIMYESGQHLVGVSTPVLNNTTITDLFIASNRHSRMRQYYHDYYQDGRDRGYALMMVFTDHFTPSKYGSWGAKEYQGQPNNECPKYLGILDFIAENRD